MATPVAGSTVTLGASGADSTAGPACGLTGGAIACAQLGAAAPRASAKPAAAMAQRDQTDIQNFAKVEFPIRAATPTGAMLLCTSCGNIRAEAHDSSGWLRRIS